jgi:FAD/FMN-containing dehydrogenase
MRTYQSWGRFPRAQHTRVLPVFWRSDPLPLPEPGETVLPYAWGRSYGDSCLNDGGALLDVTGLDRFISFDESRGLIRCEAGVSLSEILALTVPKGWFVPVVPGTQWVSLGGAIANDIHGKNHHRAGTFGAHVSCFELLRSSGERLLCSPEQHSDLFRATIGGLGLTGVILWAELRLKRVPGAGIAMERIRFGSLDQFLDLAASDHEHEYTVAWVDCLARGRHLGRGLFLRGDHATGVEESRNGSGTLFRVAVDPPPGLINLLTMKLFNLCYYRAQLHGTIRKLVPYQPFFFPLDRVGEWNRLYGPRGFFQYQCVVPDDSGRTIASLLRRISGSDETPSLAVLKRFGDLPSPGLLSFPRPGLTLAVDFVNRGPGTLKLLRLLDELVRDAGGALYPAKDARMSGTDFRRSYPAWQSFAGHVDPRFSSSFWRRVTSS